MSQTLQPIRWLVFIVSVLCLLSESPGADEPIWRAEGDGAAMEYAIGKDLPAAINARLQLAPQGRALRVSLHDADNRPVARLDIRRDKDGVLLNVRPSVRDDEGWQALEGSALTFWPRQARAVQRMEQEDGLSPQSWRQRDLPLRVELRDREVLVYLVGRLVMQTTTLSPVAGLSLTGAQDDVLGAIRTDSLAAGWQYLPVDLTPLAQVALDEPIQQAALQADGVPFELADQGRRWLDLQTADWVDRQRDPSSYYADYDRGPYFIGDQRMPMIQLPKGDYVAAHVLAVARDDENLTDHLTVRAGRYNTGYRSQVVQYDFGATVPRQSDERGSGIATAAGPLYAVRVPMTAAIAQDVIDSIMDVELTREVRLARRSPDPNRFRWRPLGLPSGVRIAAITFERSPLQMRVGSTENGHVFVQPQDPTFTVELTNISDRQQAYQLTFTATHYHGQTTTAMRTGQVAPGQSAQVQVPMAELTRGHHELAVALHDGDGRLLLERKTTFALLPDKDRPYHEQSPIGVWDFTGGHLTPDDPEFVGPIYQKLGLRFGMFGHTAEDRARFGVRQGREFALRASRGAENLIEQYEERLAGSPDMLRHLLIFHEDSISGPHVTRVPDLFHDRPRYELDEAEQKRFKEMFDMAVAGAKAMREHDPNVRIFLGNGPLPLREEFYRHNFPAELFDAAGNEAGVFGRLPETQPPDPVTNNASIWMDRQMLEHYGYGDKAVEQCFEIIYPSTNPGNLSYQTQAAYFVRHALHSMAWGIPQIRFGSLTDMGNSYYFSNWGSSGLFHRLPDVAPKPSAVAVATMTWVLDGVAFDRSIPMGSGSLYGLAFHRPQNEGRVVALWTVRGQRPVTFQLSDTNQATLIDSQGIETDLPVQDGGVTVTVTAEPAYLVIQGDVESVRPGEPVYQAQPAGPVVELDPLSSLDDWQVVTQRNPELELYNPMTPRRKGDFQFDVVPGFEGREQVVRVTPQPIEHGKDTMPMYVELAHKQGIELPGEPTEIGLWVNGNSGWGRIIYELEDASGQRWVSIGAQARAGNRWMADWLPAEMLENYSPDAVADWNTDDLFGISRINFDGWRYVGFPLPGQYPGEGYHWPINSQWRSTGDGRVHYPLTLRKVTVELPEKTLHVQTFAPADRPEIYLSNLVVVQGDQNVWVKRSPHMYVPAMQVDTR